MIIKNDVLPMPGAGNSAPGKAAFNSGGAAEFEQFLGSAGLPGAAGESGPQAVFGGANPTAKMLLAMNAKEAVPKTAVEIPANGAKATAEAMEATLKNVPAVPKPVEMPVAAEVSALNLDGQSETLTEGLSKQASNNKQLPQIADSKNVLGPHNDPRLRAPKKEQVLEEAVLSKAQNANELKGETKKSGVNKNEDLGNVDASAMVGGVVGQMPNSNLVKLKESDSKSPVPQTVPVKTAAKTRVAPGVAALKSDGKVNDLRSRSESTDSKLSKADASGTAGLPFEVLESSGGESVKSVITKARVEGPQFPSSEDYLSRLAERQERNQLKRELSEVKQNVGSNLPEKPAKLNEGNDLSLLIPQVGEWNSIADANTLNGSSGSSSPVLSSDAKGSSAIPLASQAHSQQPALELASPALIAMRVGDLAGRGGGSIRMRVVPESLGEVTISVNNEKGKLNVTFDSANPEAQALLSKHAPELRSILEASRYQVERIDVTRDPGQWLANSTNSVSSLNSTNGLSSAVLLSGDSGMNLGADRGGNSGFAGSNGFGGNAQDGYSRWDSYQSQWQEQMNGREQRNRKLWQYEQAFA